MTQPWQLDRADRLAAGTRGEVLALLHGAGDADGAYPLSEHVVLHLRHGGETPAVHLLIRWDEPGRPLVGYAHVDPTDPVEGTSAELVVHPMYRRRGLGRALVREAMEVAAERSALPGRLRVWAHGDHPSASALALSLGLERRRALLQMRRSLYTDLPEPVLPAGVRLRTFRPGVDDEPWLALNAAAFVDLPDQGGWSIADLQARLAEPWFDPEGFLLAERSADGALLGFHWTKVHGTVHAGPEMHGTAHAGPEAASADGSTHAHEPIGEVYVLGVAPQAAGTGLGAALTLAGLRYLRGLGLDQAMLYVDDANPRAVALYRRLGFARWSTDVCFHRKD